MQGPLRRHPQLAQKPPDADHRQRDTELAADHLRTISASTTRTGTASAAGPAPRSAHTAGTTADRPASAAGQAPAGPSARPCRPRGISPATHTPSCGAAPARPPHPRDARLPRPDPPPGSVAPQASCDQASGRRYPAHGNPARSQDQSQATFELLSKRARLKPPG